MECPQCQGQVWDNREENKKRIAQGQKPRPEFSCKDKDGCGWVKWAPRENKPGGFTRKSDPETQKAIIRQNSLTNAVAYCTAKANLDKEYKLTGKDVIQVATYFAKYSMGEVTVVTENEKPEEPKEVPLPVDDEAETPEEELNLDDLPF